MEQPRFILQRTGKRHRCPECNRPGVFKRYIDTHTGDMLPEHVGRCNRESNCGYHLPPREHFRTTGTAPVEVDGRAHREEAPPRPPFLHDRAEVVASRQHPAQNALSMYWRDRIGADLWDATAKRYALGTWTGPDLTGAAVYWQVDIHGRVKAGKIMLYDPATGKRAKDGRSTSFVHFETTGRNASDLNVEQCLYGEHMLRDWPTDQPVGVVESEKTALLCACLVPSILWVAVGSLSCFGLPRLQALTGRRVIAFPDLSKDGSAYLKWKTTAIELESLFDRIHVSDLLEKIATDEQREAGMDVADFFLSEQETSAPGTPAPMPKRILSEAQGLMERWSTSNPALNTLIDTCGLDMGRARLIPYTMNDGPERSQSARDPRAAKTRGTAVQDSPRRTEDPTGEAAKGTDALPGGDRTGPTLHPTAQGAPMGYGQGRNPGGSAAAPSTIPRHKQFTQSGPIGIGSPVMTTQR